MKHHHPTGVSRAREMTGSRKLRGRLAIAAVAALFSAPVLLALLLHSKWLDYQPAATTHHGRLLDPPVRITDAAPDETGNKRPLWRLLVFSQRPCNQGCLQHFSWLHRLQQALGRHRRQLQLEWLGPEPAPEAQRRLNVLGVRVMEQPAADGPLARAIRTVLPSGAIEQPQSLLIDPAGFIIMHYPAEADYNGMHEDIERLIRNNNRALGLD